MCVWPLPSGKVAIQNHTTIHEIERDGSMEKAA
jgi:hypothetical protein